MAGSERRAPAAALLLAAGVACSPAVPITPPAGPPARLVLAPGVAQAGVVGEDLPGLVGVRALDASGVPAEGARIRFEVASGGGTVSVEERMTNAGGEARTRWTLGPTSGLQRLGARLAGASPGDPALSLVHSVSALPGPPAAVLAAAGDEQEAPAGQPLAQDLEVLVVDRFGNPVEGIAVEFTCDQPDGTAIPAAAVSDPAGRAASHWTLGRQAGAQLLSASAAGLGPARFHAVATGPAPQVHLSVEAGQSQSGHAGALLPEPIVLVLRDAGGAAVPGVAITTGTAGGGATIPASGITDSAGQFAVGWTLGPDPGPQRLMASATDAATGLLVRAEAFAEALPGPAASLRAAETDLSRNGPVTGELELRDAAGHAMAGAAVSLLAGPGSGAVSPTTLVIGPTGFGEFTWTPGPLVGEQQVIARHGELPPLVFTRRQPLGWACDGEYEATLVRTGGTLDGCEGPGAFSVRDGVFGASLFDPTGGVIGADGAASLTVAAPEESRLVVWDAVFVADGLGGVTAGGSYTAWRLDPAPAASCTAAWTAVRTMAASPGLTGTW